MKPETGDLLSSNNLTEEESITYKTVHDLMHKTRTFDSIF